MRKLNHCNISKLEGVYETGNSIYVILEYLEGRQLNETLKVSFIPLRTTGSFQLTTSERSFRTSLEDSAIWQNTGSSTAT